MTHRSVDLASATRPIRVVAFLAVAIIVVLAGCSTESDGTTDDATAAGGEELISVVATTSIWGDVTRTIVQGDGEVEVLVPIGTDPHDFQASSSEVEDLYAADLVVANGLGLEEGLDDILEAAEGDGVAVLEVAPRVDPIAFGSTDHDDADHDEGTDAECDPTLDHAHDGEEANDDEGVHDEGSCDPHVWMDPSRVAEGAQLIAAALAEIAPGVDWASRADAYGVELAEADQTILTTLAQVDENDRIMVTNHDSFGYFADRYGFEILGVVVPGGSTLGDPSSRELAQLVETMEAEGVSAIFVETIQPTALAEAVSAELGGDVAVVELYTGSLGEPGSGADTVVGMLETNARRIAEALS